MNGPDDHMMWGETDTEMIFKHEDGNEVLLGFITKDMAAVATGNINKLLME